MNYCECTRDGPRAEIDLPSFDKQKRHYFLNFINEWAHI